MTALYTPTAQHKKTLFPVTAPYAETGNFSTLFSACIYPDMGHICKPAAPRKVQSCPGSSVCLSPELARSFVMSLHRILPWGRDLAINVLSRVNIHMARNIQARYIQTCIGLTVLRRGNGNLWISLRRFLS